MRPGAESDPVVLSTKEFEVLCHAEKLRHPEILDVSGDAEAEDSRDSGRPADPAQAWAELRAKRLAEQRADRAEAEFADLLGLLDRPQRSVDVRVWADRSVRALASARGGAGLLTIVDEDIVEITPIRASALAEAAVSVAGDGAAGRGRSVSVPNDVLYAASDTAGANNSQVFVDELRVQGVGFDDAHSLARMAEGAEIHGEFGADNGNRRANRVVGFHDTPAGRYLHVVRPSGDGRRWSTIVPADNRRIAEYVWELLTEIAEA